MVRGPMFERWRSTSFLVSPELDRDFFVLLKRQGISVTKFFNTMAKALLLGDITMDELQYGEIKSVKGVDVSLDHSTNVIFRDRDGRILNPSKWVTEDDDDE